MSRIYTPRVGDIVTFDSRTALTDWLILAGYRFRVTRVSTSDVDVEPLEPLPTHNLAHFRGFYHHRFMPLSRPLYRRG